MKTTRVSLLLLALVLCLSSHGLAQSNATPGYKSAHKNAEKYQKSLRKKQSKQQKAAARTAKANYKQHQSQN